MSTSSPMQPADEFACSRALGSLAAFLDSGSLARALRLARGMRDPGARARSLAVVVRALPEADRPAVLAEALASARSIGDPWRRVRALTPVAVRLPAEAREPVAREALAAALAVRGDWLRGRALGLLANFAVGQIRERAMQAAVALGSPNERASALCAFADDLPAPLVDELLSYAETIDDDWLLQSLVTSLTGRLPARDFDRALGIARRIHGVPSTLALLALAQASSTNAQGLFEEALTRARALEQPSDRAEAITALLEGLPSALRAAAAAEALAAARTVDDLAVRAMQLTDLLPRLPETSQAESCAEGLAAARQIEDPILRVERLSGFVAHQSPPDRATDIDGIISAMETLSPPE
jgi:hypothetical protein